MKNRVFQAKKHSPHIAGIGYMLSAMLIFVCVNALAKETISRYHLLQIIFFRSFFTLIPCLFLFLKAGGLRVMKTQHPCRHLLGGCVGTVALLGLFESIRLLPLANAITLHLSETFFLTILCAIFLKEHAGIHRWLAIIVGFVGVLIITRPSSHFSHFGALCGILFALGDGFFWMNARILTRTDHSATIVIYFVLIASGITGIFLPLVWKTPSLKDFIVLIFLGIGAGTGQICVTQAYRYAPAATIAPMIYSALLWGILLGYLFWGEIPDAMLLLGASLIIAGGLYIIYRETRHKADITAIPSQSLPKAEY